MLQVSDNAKSLLKDLLDKRSDPTHVLRLSKEGESLELRFDVPAEGDVVFQHEETDVIAVASDVADSFEGVTIDRKDSPEGPRLEMVKRAATDRS